MPVNPIGHDFDPKKNLSDFEKPIRETADGHGFIDEIEFDKKVETVKKKIGIVCTDFTPSEISECSKDIYAGGGVPMDTKKRDVFGRKWGRNDGCPCGSFKKYKHCCLNKK